MGERWVAPGGLWRAASGRIGTAERAAGGAWRAPAIMHSIDRQHQRTQPQRSSLRDSPAALQTAALVATRFGHNDLPACARVMSSGARAPGCCEGRARHAAEQGAGKRRQCWADTSSWACRPLVAARLAQPRRSSLRDSQARARLNAGPRSCCDSRDQSSSLRDSPLEA